MIAAMTVAMIADRIPAATVAVAVSAGAVTVYSLLGYENDGCRFTFAGDGRLAPVATLGVPENLEIIGMAPAAFGEEEGRGYAPIIPPENLDIIASDVFADESAATRRRLLHGHAVMASFRRGAGEVFNCGTTEWAHGLKARDPFVERITRNVLRRFGAF